MQPVKNRFRFTVGVFGLAVAGTAAWIGMASAGFTSHEEMKLRSCSPDASYCASLVLRNNSNPLSSDVYYLRLKNMKNPAAWSHWADFGKGQQILMTTEAGPSRLVWRDNKHLIVICDACKMAFGDVVRERHRSGSVSISYTGFVPSVE